jgi:hypothetical protein
MPTIDELAPATAATDGDEFPVSQNSITRKITRAQILAGVQAQLSIPGGTLLGRVSPGFGLPETIAIGNYLNLASGTLSAIAAPYSIALSSVGLVPAATDLVPLGQGGGNVSVSYRTFLQGLAAISGVDGTQLTVTPTGNTVSLRLADLASSMIARGGGSLSGPLSLANDPSGPLQAATKQYVDLKVSRSGDTLTGPLQLTGDPTTALQAATKGYVDTNAGVLRLGLTMAGPLVLVADPTVSLNPATKSYADARLLRAGDTMTGPLGLSVAPVSGSQATTKNYVDAQIAMSLPLNGGMLNGPLTLSSDPTAPLQAATKQYVDTKVNRAGDTLSGPLTLAGSPTSTFHAAPKSYVDAQIITALPKSGGIMSGPILLSGDPTAPSQAATKYYVDSGLAGTLGTTGGTVTGPITLTAVPALPPHVVNKQYVDGQISGLLPLSVLSYSSAADTIVAKYAATACAVGRGMSVSFAIVFSTTATLPAASAGSMVCLIGLGSYTITLPPANTVTAGTGFTFSAMGSGIATIVPANGDTIDLAPISLRQYDRYHVISDGSSLWHDIFRTNSVSPRFAAPPILPSYSVVNLPAPSAAGAKAFSTNGRKPNESSGSGTGVEVFFDGTHWISVCSGAPVAA